MLLKRIFLSLIILTSLSFNAYASDKIGGRWILQNHFGEVVTDQHFTGKFRLIFFGYTFCPDVCPTALSNVSDAMDLLNGIEEEIQPLFISVDAKRDNPRVLREYVENFHPSIIGLTGNESIIKRTADLFKVKYNIAPNSKPDEEYYLIDHSAGLYFMSPTGVFITKFAHGVSGEYIANRIKEILATNK